MKTLNLWAFIDRFIGCDDSTDLQQTLRARLAFAFGGMMALIAIVNVVVLAASENSREGMVEIGILAAAVFTGSSLLGIWSRRPSVTMILMALFTAGIYAAAIYGNRGDVPPAFAYTPCVLLGFYQFWGPRSLIVIIPGFLTAIGAVVALGVGYDNPTPYPFGALLLALGLSSIWLIILAAVTSSIQDLAARRLLQANEGLATALAESQAAQRAKSEFLANVGHEVRTPLNGVLGMADVMHKVGGLPPDQAERLELIRDSGKTLLELLNEILDQSKIETGQVITERVPFDLENLTSKTVASWRPEAESRGLDLHLDLSQMQHKDVTGDPLRIRQILNNLISNALKFTETGHVTLHVSQSYMSDGAGWLTTLDVIDTGTGVPEDKLESIFEAFHQADASITRRYGGTGLGLSISRDLARIMNGDLFAYGMPEGGTCFCLTLPLTPAETRPDETLAGSDAASTPRLDPERPIRILSVDDVPTNHIVIRALLEQLLATGALQVDTALSGPAAMEAVDQTRYDLVFMDIQMPDMDGVTAARHIREATGETGPTLVAVSALEADQSARILPDGLFEDVLAKPTALGALETVLARWQAAHPVSDTVA